MADVSSLNSVALDFLNSSVNSVTNSSSTTSTSNDAFSTLLSSAMDMVNETNSLSNAAEEAQLNFSLGNLDNTHDVSVAQQKAYLSLQYTVAVKNKLLDAYKEIMNIQI